MKAMAILASLALLGPGAMSGAAHATPRTYVYAVNHPVYGTIGTYSHTIDEEAGVTRSASTLRVLVKWVGLVLYRQENDTTEVSRGNRLVSFQSVSKTNGHQLTVHGEADDKNFVVTSPKGPVTAPLDVAPSNPWALTRLGPAVVVSIDTGKVDNVEVTGGEAATVALNGTTTEARHYHVGTDTQPDKWEVWFDAQNVPIKFRMLQDGTPIEFTLTSSGPAPGDASNINPTADNANVGAPAKSANASSLP